MRLGQRTNNFSCEFEMQEKLGDWLKCRELLYVDELLISEVHRRADFLVLFGTLVINIEAKCNNLICLMDQLEDHARYSDYSFAYIHDCGLTPMHFKQALLTKGYGLLVYNHENGTITEVLEAHKNKSRDIKLRNKIRECIIFKSKKYVED